MQHEYKSTAKSLERLTQSETEEVKDNRPQPNDFCSFLPWACNQYQLESTVVITKVIQSEYVSVGLADKSRKTRTTRQNTSRRTLTSSEGKEEKSPDDLPQLMGSQKIIKILAYCDLFGNLVELKFDKNKQLPCLIFKIMALIIKYQTYLTRITINGGMDMQTIYEMDKFLYFTNITEICFDNSFFPEANYDLLFEGRNKIRYISLSRCKIDDAVVENIAKKLAYPLPASKFLTALILSSNRITDRGVVPLAKALRSNRQLSYISLADNSLTDDGVGLILDSLTEFLLTEEEVIDARSRYMYYLKEKNVMVKSMIKELRAGEFDKTVAKRKASKPVTASSKKKKLEKESSLKSLGDSRSNPNLDYLFYDKAVNIVEERLGEFNDPFSSSNTSVKDGMKYCYGNNAVCYLNLAYNSISYISLKKLSNVLMSQKLFDRKPRGLVNICVEGNNLPVSCKELSQIEDLLKAALMSIDYRMSTVKRKPTSKNTPR
ncbi:uncharacterized protein LOC123877236 [Maniola jurtina]|uniref:uncharacterized protein LOC123877236 n=1 Tax=Maniola jurtina TaxID=191418 RepID=UPI001E68B53A|nr:uncharacterized protein LOC123877236 [Maniola jurtina]